MSLNYCTFQPFYELIYDKKLELVIILANHHNWWANGVWFVLLCVLTTACIQIKT